jgi:hypothetical protein
MALKHGMKHFYTIGVTALMMVTGCSKAPESLVPDTPSKATDYFCTWNVQGYVCSYENSGEMRKNMTENNMFGHNAYQNWVNFFPRIREDLIFIMDDSWDIPISETSKDGPTFGLTELNQERFPTFTGSPAARLSKLVDSIKTTGWKGLGGWICAQEAAIVGKVDPVEYWIERLQAADEAGFAYWKVDWGKQSRNLEWRKMLTNLGHTHAPNLVIEHALNAKPLEFSDAYRTYDVENIIAQPLTIRRVAGLLKYKAQGKAKGIINCEDEPYIAAGLGCAIGVMRHPFVGQLPNNTQDFAFPPVGRDIKNRLDEVIRGVRWHRIAAPFGVGSTSYCIDSTVLNDYWVLEEKETWLKSRNVGDTIRESAPARVSRALPLAKILNTVDNPPFVLSSLYPNGAVAIVTIGRGIDHEYITERVHVEQNIESIEHPIGIFGDFASLTLIVPGKIKAADYTVFGQDLAGDVPVDITSDIRLMGNKITIPGNVIREIGLSAASEGDLSDPGLVLKLKRYIVPARKLRNFPSLIRKRQIQGFLSF